MLKARQRMRSLSKQDEKKLALPISRVAGWYIFEPKIPIWVNFGGPKNGKCWYI
jgi:hypothetical protein